MATKLDMGWVKHVRESQRDAHNGFESLVSEVQRLEDQVDAHERACSSIIETITSYGRQWGCSHGTENPSLDAQTEILKAVRGIIEVAARNVSMINESNEGYEK